MVNVLNRVCFRLRRKKKSSRWTKSCALGIKDPDENALH